MCQELELSDNFKVVLAPPPPFRLRLTSVAHETTKFSKEDGVFLDENLFQFLKHIQLESDDVHFHLEGTYVRFDLKSVGRGTSLKIFL